MLTPAQPAPSDGPTGIGGWLILPILGIVGTPLYWLVQMSQYTGLAESFPFLTSGQKAFLSLEIAGGALISIIFPVVLLVLLSQKKRTFPRWYVIWAVLNMIYLVGDLAGAKILFGDILAASSEPLIDDETLKALIRAVLLMVIWVPYMLTSRRVRNTFVQ